MVTKKRLSNRLAFALSGGRGLSQETSDVFPAFQHSGFGLSFRHLRKQVRKHANQKLVLCVGPARKARRVRPSVNSAIADLCLDLALYQLVDRPRAVIQHVQFPRGFSAESTDQKSSGQQKIPLPHSRRGLMKTPNLSPGEVPKNVLSRQSRNCRPAVYVAANDGIP